MRDAYDEVAYPGSAFADTHPDRLATIAHLHGLAPARPDRCRVLELGCGDGANLISLAYALPDATFTGVDRAPDAIARGRAAADRLGLANVRLDVADLLDVEARCGEFDFIIAHGLFSWVPEPVRLKALDICAASLAPDGVAFISYLALPGNHARDMFRDAMRFHVRGVSDPAERVRQARALMRLLADAPGGRAEHRALAKSVAEELDRADDGVVYHDFLAEDNAAYLFGDFIRLAGDAGLQFLAEAEYDAGFLRTDGAPAYVLDALRRIETDVLLREQYYDFFRYRNFRQTLLCRADLDVDRPPRAERVRALHIAAHVATPDGMVDLRDGVPVHFATQGGEWTLADAASKAALAVLGSVWPRVLPFTELVARVRDVSPHAPDEDALAGFLLRAITRAAAELWTCAPPCADASADRPVGSAVARLQLARGSRRVSSLRNETIELTDDLAAATLALLDGTRDRAQLVDGLAASLNQRGVTMELDGRPITDVQEVRRILAGRLDDALDELAENALLVASDDRKATAVSP